jgi:hypothetical protein
MFWDKKVEGVFFFPLPHWSRKWLLNEEVAYKRLIKCTNAVELRNIGKCWYEARCK